MITMLNVLLLTSMDHIAVTVACSAASRSPLSRPFNTIELITCLPTTQNSHIEPFRHTPIIGIRYRSCQCLMLKLYCGNKTKADQTVLVEVQVFYEIAKLKLDF